MANIENIYVGDGSTVLYSFTFPYISEDDVKVSLDGVDTTAYQFATATTVQLAVAPTSGVVVRIYRETPVDAVTATFFPGSAIRAQDLNDNFTQILYTAQETAAGAGSALSSANSALALSNTAATNAAAAVTTANAADANAAAAVSTAGSASTVASNAVTVANQAQSDATAASNVAAQALAASATAVSTANSATSTANAASTKSDEAKADAVAATSAANSAVTSANSAVSTANAASSSASSAVTTANTALSTANAASTTAADADGKANQAINAVANALLFSPVTSVAFIPGSPKDNDAVEVKDSTGIESFTPLLDKPAGFVGDSGLAVRIVYDTAVTSWRWIQYVPNDPDKRYLNPTDQAAITSAISAAQADATKGIADAATAKTAADAAQTSANAAQSSANTAKSSADAAQADATQALANAATAQSAANAAQTSANTANSGVSTLNSTVITSISGTAPISVSGTGNSRSVVVANATETAVGVVELATSAEVLAGTDTTRVVTPATLKAHYIPLDFSSLPALP